VQLVVGISILQVKELGGFENTTKFDLPIFQTIQFIYNCIQVLLKAVLIVKYLVVQLG